ncbi:glucuronate isomerase [Kocuria sp. cx-116]|uniref:glucuronate isomerase n=1 Tax=Kocuria sp. cx-116 TaxID=2771378 RepID=UPI001685ABCE|nr:glucuronate isomerase [Kocuria sp. cx-116]MBD2763036.1 glucuronate isomerase [Kocuria sp. cx-116]
MSTSIAAHPDRLLPADPGTRAIARNLLTQVEDLPIVSPHGHVDARIIADNTPFPDPTQLLISPDHYVTRLLHANGVNLSDLNVGNSSGADPREAWRIFCRNWHLYDGTASGYWLRSEFVNVFGIDDSRINETNADELYDRLQNIVARPDFRPRELFEKFKLEVMATTDDPLDDLSAHEQIAADTSFSGRVLPTFRPDAYVKFHGAGFTDKAQKLIDTAGEGRTGYEGYIRAMENRRAYFVDRGAVSADHGTLNANTLKLDSADAARLFDKGLRGEATVEEANAFEAHMTYQFARMSVADGLVMTIHPGVYRNHSPETFDRFGADTGHDIPFAMEYTRGLQPLLGDFGNERDFHFVLFTIDETVYSREIAPLAGFYPSVYVGAPWWFIDEPDAMFRWRSAITGTAGFSRSSGFIDDTRAFCSIPARHDASRRTEAAFLAKYVAEHRISEERAAEIIVDIVDAAPRRVFKL